MKDSNLNLKIATFKDLLLVRTLESGEKMINISNTLKNCICIYQQSDMFLYVGNDLWVRESVANKLQKIADNLKKSYPELFLKVVYGFRHPEIQEFYFIRRKNSLKLVNKNMGEETLNELVNTMTAYPETAGHPTGGAVDITICTENNELDMGTRISDFSDPEKIKTYCDYLNNEQKRNRKILHDLMVSEEFAPYYGEWWHFSFGDKEWAFFYSKPCAIYGKIDFRIDS